MRASISFKKASNRNKTHAKLIEHARLFLSISEVQELCKVRSGLLFHLLYSGIRTQMAERFFY